MIKVNNNGSNAILEVWRVSNAPCMLYILYCLSSPSLGICWWRGWGRGIQGVKKIGPQTSVLARQYINHTSSQEKTTVTHSRQTNSKKYNTLGPDPSYSCVIDEPGLFANIKCKKTYILNVILNLLCLYTCYCKEFIVETNLKTSNKPWPHHILYLDTWHFDPEIVLTQETELIWQNRRAKTFIVWTSKWIILNSYIRSWSR